METKQTVTLSNGVELENIAALDRGESLFFSHYDPEVVGWLAGLGK